MVIFLSIVIPFPKSTENELKSIERRKKDEDKQDVGRTKFSRRAKKVYWRYP